MVSEIIMMWFGNNLYEMRVPKVEGGFKGLKLPREVIDKVYLKNAEKWLSGK